MAVVRWNDVELVTHTATGDVAAFEALYARFGRLVFSLCIRVLGDWMAAEEVAQDAFLRVWHQAVRYDPARGTPVTWLLTIANRLAIDRIRRRSEPIPHSPAVETAVAASLGDPEEQAVISVVGVQVRSAIRDLAPEQRQMLWLTYFCGYTHREAAAAVAVPLGTVKSRVRLGLQNLRRLIGEEAHPQPERVGSHRGITPRLGYPTSKGHMTRAASRGVASTSRTQEGGDPEPPGLRILCDAGWRETDGGEGTGSSSGGRVSH